MQEHEGRERPCFITEFDPSPVLVFLRFSSLSVSASRSYEVTVPKARRSLVKEVALAGLASILLGFGVLFLLLWAGVWV
jgi:hypothetical protein